MATWYGLLSALACNTCKVGYGKKAAECYAPPWFITILLVNVNRLYADNRLQ